MGVMWHRTLLILGVLAPACAIDSQPVPDNTDEFDARDENAGDPAPTTGADGDSAMVVDPTQVFHSGASDGTSPRLIVGLPGAVIVAAAEVRFENVSRPEAGTRTRAPAEDGSFAVTFDAVAGETIRIVVLNAVAEEEEVLDTTSVVLRPPSMTATERSEALDMFLDNPPFSGAPNASGFATLSLPAGSVAAGGEFVVANIGSGNAVIGTAEQDGSLVVQIAAVTGDQLEVFAIDALSSNGGGAAFTYVVP